MRTGDLPDPPPLAELLAGLTPGAAAMIEQLQAELARLNIPAWPGPVLNPAEGVLTIWYGLVARTDGRVIWWRRPHDSAAGRALYTFAASAATAAVRLVEDYAEARRQPLELWQALSSRATHTRPSGLPV